VRKRLISESVWEPKALFDIIPPPFQHFAAFPQSTRRRSILRAARNRDRVSSFSSKPDVRLHRKDRWS
jgi:hypothetical protein